MNLRWILLASALLLLLTTGAALAAHTERVSVSTGEKQGNGACRSVAISADGRYVAFGSEAANLVPDDTNEWCDVFVRDRLLGTTERVSLSREGGQGDSSSERPSISADGRFVAFFSFATNLVPEDTNYQSDVFVRDRLLRTTERVSVSSSGQQGDTASWCPCLSVDGRFVAFWSTASTLASGDAILQPDVFLRDRLAGRTELISAEWEGRRANNASLHPSVSGDGRFVAYDSVASNLVPRDTNAASDIFVRDRVACFTERPSLSSAGQQSNGGSQFPSISGDGRFVTFFSRASNLVPGDTNNCGDIFLHDRSLETTERVSVNDLGEPGNADCYAPSISAHGRFVAFLSPAANLASGDTNNVEDAFLRDRLLGTTERASVSTSGEQANGLSSYVSISAHGRFVAYCSEASNLVPDDTNGTADIFVRVLDVEEVTFADVPATHWAYQEIQACVAAGIVSGYPDWSYQPRHWVTRDQMAVFISRSICTPTGEAGMVDYISPSTPTFPDVATDYWAYKYIEYAAEHNIVGGYPDGLYHANEPVNRAQMAVFAARAMVTPSGDAGVPAGPAEPTFPDVTSTGDWSWCYDHVEHIAEKGVTQGYLDGYYHPEYTCARDMLAVYITRAFDLPM